ncbi:Octopine catabolism/uptake operon regulatory protein OccR [Roseobacter fucihabitans]|uniref:Octopine catabolism/uptake operon regulatory protein OccR n=1 Tax=Roseobacter fucihabitans TaxID=1537242 RepID=A0ABZ2BWS5_9RHOB|nr:LysR family transcriptional regulator [Roseobacter litoralis]MBC6966940.1 HTH-type transcriptional regulator CynR [Roseobacter litoralis]
MVGKTTHSLNEYQALRALMESGTTSKAAIRLGLSQSAVSRSIASLEARTGRLLFERDAGRLRPTHEAAQMNRRLDPLFEALDRIDGPPDVAQETLRIIAPPTYAHRFLVHHIATFLKINPHFFVSLEVSPSEDVIRGILERRFDIGLTGVELSRDGVKLTPYRTSSAVCAMAVDHPLVGLDVVRPEDLDGQQLIALTHRHARRAQLERALHGCRSTPKIVAEVSTAFAAVDLAKEGLGLAIVNPFPVVHYRSDEVIFKPFASHIEYRSYFVTPDHGAASGIARAFMRHLRLHTATDDFSQKA